ncbi:major facilitator superfamily domain-containing protein [Hysterangium stoloniferum]|nr:major facilitator superfamily domain-containing protein [Hysterangium stoloniferum]
MNDSTHHGHESELELEQSKLESSEQISIGLPTFTTKSPPPEIEEYPDGGLKAWSVVFAVRLIICISMQPFGFVNSYGVFQTYYQKTLLPHNSRASISWIGSMQTALVFFPNVITGRTLDLGHFRIPLHVSSTLFITGVFLVSECKTYWQLLLCQGVVVGFSAGLLFGPTPACVMHWFLKRRFLSFGIVAAGSPAGGTLLPIVTRILLKRVGYPWTIRILGFILLVPLVAINLLLRPRFPPRNLKGGLFNFAMFKHPPFVLYIIGMDLVFLGFYVPLIYFDSAAQEAGLSPSITVYLISIANSGSFIGRVTVGLLADRYGALNVQIPVVFLGGIVLFAWPYATSMAPLVIVAFIYGCCNGGFVGLLPNAPSKMGTVGDLGRRVGMVTTCAAFGTIAGTPIAGAIRTASNGFHSVGAYAGSMFILGACVLSVSKRLALGSWRGTF